MDEIPFENNCEEAKAVNQIVHTDLNGAHHIKGNKGENYFIMFLDDFSKCARI